MKSLIVMIRCSGYPAFHVLIGAVMNAKNEGIEILSHDQETKQHTTKMKRATPTGEETANDIWLRYFR